LLVSNTNDLRKSGHICNLYRDDKIICLGKIPITLNISIERKWVSTDLYDNNSLFDCQDGYQVSTSHSIHLTGQWLSPYYQIATLLYYRERGLRLPLPDGDATISLPTTNPIRPAFTSRIIGKLILKVGGYQPTSRVRYLYEYLGSRYWHYYHSIKWFSVTRLPLRIPLTFTCKYPPFTDTE